MKRIGLVVKNDDRAKSVAADLKVWLEAHGLEVFQDEPRTIAPEHCESANGDGGLMPKTDLVVVLGGDGTLLYAARTVGRNGVPMLGVNMGGLGFLTEIGLENLRPTIEQVLAGAYTAEARMMLSVEVIRPDSEPIRHTVLNDAVINKGALARILRLKVKVGEFNLGEYRADGLIIATPTGSTAYNLAAGGPIIHPVHETIVLTPICPFTLSNRPLILPVNSVIEIRLGSGDADVLLTSDGQVSCPLHPNDVVIIRRSKDSIFLIKNPYKNYFDILRTKLGWG
jgi:NAD+ kinase